MSKTPEIHQKHRVHFVRDRSSNRLKGDLKIRVGSNTPQRKPEKTIGLYKLQTVRNHNEIGSDPEGTLIIS